MNMQDIHEGMKVHAADGANLGKVVEMNEEVFVIEKGFFFPKEYVARYNQIDDIRNDEIWLRESETDLRSGHAVEEREIEREGERREEREIEREGARREAATTEESRIPGSREEVVVPLAEEELEARTTERQVGEVRVRKEVITEEQEIDVPVRREEVRVEHVPESGAATEAAFEEGETRIPIYEEEVEVTKRPVVREEVRVSKAEHEDVEHVRGKVRKEVAEIEEDVPRKEK